MRVSPGTRALGLTFVVHRVWTLLRSVSSRICSLLLISIVSVLLFCILCTDIISERIHCWSRLGASSLCSDWLNDWTNLSRTCDEPVTSTFRQKSSCAGQKQIQYWPARECFCRKRASDEFATSSRQVRLMKCEWTCLQTPSTQWRSRWTAAERVTWPRFHTDSVSETRSNVPNSVDDLIQSSAIDWCCCCCCWWWCLLTGRDMILLWRQSSDINCELCIQYNATIHHWTTTTVTTTL